MAAFAAANRRACGAAASPLLRPPGFVSLGFARRWRRHRRLFADRLSVPAGRPPCRSRSKRGAAEARPEISIFMFFRSPGLPAFARRRRAARARGQCDPGANLGFVVHGLWPQYEHGYPSDCGPAARFPSRIALETAQGLYPSEGLARHEWRKHGTCSGKSPTDYFADVRRARDVHHHSLALCRPQGATDLDADRYCARVHRRQSAAAAGHAGRCLRAQRPARGEDLLFQGSAGLSRLPGGKPARLPRAGDFGAAFIVTPHTRQTPALEREPAAGRRGMNYRHEFHAGNFADVFKHIFLTRALLHLGAKPAPFRYIETHAGSGHL